jgi:hypothetical protein
LELKKVGINIVTRNLEKVKEGKLVKRSRNLTRRGKLKEDEG